VSWKASIQRFEIQESHTWIPIGMYVGKDLHAEILAPPHQRINIFRVRVDIPLKDSLNFAEVRGLTFRFPERNVAAFGGGNLKMGNGVDPIFDLENLEVFKLEVFSPLKRVVLNGEIQGEFVDA
jgi:hypothetical protein